jgi:hypothetical protein
MNRASTRRARSDLAAVPVRVEEPTIDRDFAANTRTRLDDNPWVDHAPRCLHGADLVFADLIAVLPWRQREVTMYDRRVLEPRLTAWWSTATPGAEALPVLADARAALTHRYARPFDSAESGLGRPAPVDHVPPQPGGSGGARLNG